DPIAASWIQAFVSTADGSLSREAQGSPLQRSDSDNKLPFGAVTFVNEVQVSGYAADPDVLPGPIDVDVSIDGAHVARIRADRNFEVLQHFTSLKEPQHAFTFAPPDAYRDGKAHTIQFFAVNQPAGPNPELQGSPATFVGKRNSPPIGWLDVADLTGVRGWAY